MKYLKRWIENTFPNIEVKVSDSGSCYYDLNGCLAIRISDHFSPVPRNRIDIEIVQSLNNESFAIRYKKSLSFFLYDRTHVKNIICTMYDIGKSDNTLKKTDEEIIENHQNKLIEKYTKPLSLMRILINNGRYNDIVTSKKTPLVNKALDKCELFMAQGEAIKKEIRKAFVIGITGVSLLDLVVRSYMSKDVNEVKKIISEMREYKEIISLRGKEKHASEAAAKIIEDISKEINKE